MQSDSKKYDQALEYLNSLVDNSLIPNLDKAAARFDLQRVRDLLGLMGDPQNAYPIIHIAGTKGKGSTAAMLDSVLRSAGYQTGLFTSPYLFDFCEQMQVNGEPIGKDALGRQVEEIKPLISQVKGITTFEAVTAICFQYFKEQQIDIAIVEAGLGGRTDATNVVTPLISVITSISLDHTAMLGNSIEAITGEKAGILKTGRPSVAAPQAYAEAVKSILKAAAERGSELTLVENEVEYGESSRSLDGQVFSVKFKDHDTAWNGEYSLSLLGRHQIENAATALTVLRKLCRLGFDLSIDQVRLGLQHVHWPCRFEVVSRNPLIVLDGAHNADSAKRLKQTLAEYLEGYKITLIFGALVDKDISGMFEALLPGIGKVIFSKSEHPRAAEPALLVKLIKDAAVQYEITENLDEAIERARHLTDEKSAIVVTGSLFTAAAARQVIINPQ